MSHGRNEPLLVVEDLHVHFPTREGTVQAVRGVSFAMEPGECVALVGESGCGKSVTALAILGLVPPPGRVVGGRIRLGGRDLLGLSERELERVRGRAVGMVFQDPMTSLNPVLTVGFQIMEVLHRHQGLRGAAARRRAAELLSLVGIPQAEARLGAYPHQFSGGMRQRAMIAMALAANPQLLIADEPTTALDVTIQAQILDLLRQLKRRLQMAVLLITHDLGVVAGLADRVVVLYAGQVVEQGPVAQIFHDPRHPYTWSLLRSVPRLDAPAGRRLVPIAGQPPDLLRPPAGCPFRPRCPYAMAVCLDQPPTFVAEGDHTAACWLQHPDAPRPAAAGAAPPAGTALGAGAAPATGAVPPAGPASPTPPEREVHRS